MKKIVIANWKCNPTSLKEAKLLFDSVKKGVKNIKDREVVICPPFVYVSSFKFSSSAKALADRQVSRKESKLPTGQAGFKIGAQDCFWENKGAFTGEVSTAMLKDLGCEYVIVGHSERRQYFGETDEIVNRKIKAVIAAKLTPILCVGESQKQRENGETIKVLRKQLTTAFRDVSSFKFQISRPIIAYEPLWAIGAGRASSPDDAVVAAIFLQKELQKIFARAGKTARIIYGGSVNAQNAKDYLKEPSIQGVLVGGAALKPKEFINTCSLGLPL